MLEDSLTAVVDYGDGVPRRALVGVGREKVGKGDIVIVHAGVIISKLDEKGIMEQIELFREILGDEDEVIKLYENILRLSRLLSTAERG